jgi:hypothetical protein
LEELEAMGYDGASDYPVAAVTLIFGRARSRFSHASICGFIVLMVWGCYPLLSSECYARTVAMVADDDSSSGLSRDASWQTPEANQMIDSFNQWFAERQDSPSSVDELAKYLKSALAKIREAGRNAIDSDSINSDSAERLDVVIDGIALVRPDIRRLRDQLRQPHDAPVVLSPEFDFDNVTENSFVANHAALYYGRWLAQHQFYDEALERLEKVSLAEVLDPAALLFYRGLMEHQLLKKERCLATVNQLLENADSIPRRYAVVGRLMVADIEPMKVDSLNEIARLMNDVGRRTGLNRSGKRVRDQEKEVIEKLDKLIEEAEKKQQQQKRQQAAARSAQGPNKPLKTSQIAGGGASGEVKKKRLDEGGQWGDLPPAERAAALAEMSKDMPPHYRAVIEEYFRRLADQSK